MKITNKENLPKLLVEAVTHDRYEAGHGDISVTTLISPPQQRHLRVLHGEETIEDASERVWSLLGSSVHYMIENAKMSMIQKGTWNENNIVEERFYCPMNLHKTVSAQIDLYDDDEGTLNDFKVTSVWAVKDGLVNGKDEWEQQLNVQRYLMAKNGVTVKSLFIIAIARDWNKSGKLRDKNYPPRVAKISVPMWTMEQTEKFINDRLDLHYSWTDHPIACTPKECWEKPTKYALMKKGRQSALRLGDTMDFVLDYAFNNDHALKQVEAGVSVIVLKNGFTIDIRVGERIRCENYCDVAPFCEQYKEWKAEYEV